MTAFAGPQWTAATVPSAQEKRSNQPESRRRLARGGRALILLTAAAVLSARSALGVGAEPQEQLSLRISFGHRSPEKTNVSPLFLPGSPLMSVEAVTGSFEVGAGVVRSLTVETKWPRPTQSPRQPHEIWRYLLGQGTAGQAARLKDDPGLQPDAPVLTVWMDGEATRGFSIGLDQLIRHRALWLPAHDAFVTLAQEPVDFATHLASLQGERVLERVQRAPEATLAEWINRWDDVGNPIQYNQPWETTWLGVKGHLTGLVARHGSIYKFGVDRWGNVRPDHASPHKFRLDLDWLDWQWKGQRIVDGLPVIVTRLERGAQRCEVEQFAAPLNDGPPSRRGEIHSVLATRLRMGGAGAVNLGFRMATERTNRHPELRTVAGRTCVVDRETGAVWLMVEGADGLSLTARPSLVDGEDPRLEFECAAQLPSGEPRELVLKLPSPVVPPEAVSELAALDFERGRAATVAYWEDWLARGARFEVPEPAVNDLFRANLWHALLLPRHRRDEQGAPRLDLPYSNFAYGQYNADWPINQAVYVDYMIYGLRGYFAVAEEEFAAMYRSQQQADGRVGGYADWGVYSPGMLYAVGQNYLLSGDRASFDRLLPASLSALDWCLRQIPKGQTSLRAPGLIVAPLNDLTHEARAWAFPNAYFVAGLEVFGRALAWHQHPRADEVRAVTGKLRTDVRRAFARASTDSPVVQLADGTWNNYVPCDALTPRRLLHEWYPTDVDCGPLHLARLGVLDPQGWLTQAMLDDHEDNLFLNQWGMANEPVYNPQGTVYLRRDQPEAAIRTFYSMMACGFSHHQLTPLEHRWAWGQYYGPPSTDGAWFELYRNLLVNELQGGDTLFVGQAVPRAWLRDGQPIKVERAPTQFGPVSFKLEGATAIGRMRAEIEFTGPRRPSTLLLRLRHPERRTMRTVTVNGAAWTDFDPAREWVRLMNPAERRYEITTHD